MTTSIRHLYPILGESLRRRRLLSKVIGLGGLKLKKQICMRSAIFNVLAIVLASLMSFARLSIENPKHVNIPEEQARLLLRLSCRAVAHELHLRESSISEMDMHLVLGEKDEGFGYDEHAVPTLFLREWDEKKFVTAALRFGVERSIDQHRQEQLIVDILNHYQQISPISAGHLHNSAASPSQLPHQGNNCLSRISDATISGVGCNIRNAVSPSE